ncbi:kinase-like domain-containing protein [Clohesyomyces aquaticus]|uniref:Kinase-like domain-containing protein n=1 Tax=Clohesyomyces aquaticus TaxID=1231657 RepID=A0A1Y2ABC5_9PLEO|nr:kinase-like domain-containing protein [Clohesyomyces aquaticus]
MTSAVEYLHSQSIRHKDLKPSNILLSRENLWLTDFGMATDFSLLSTSATENGERGAPKYFAPEVADYTPSGRAADIFSLGYIYLEICVLYTWGNLDHLKSLRLNSDQSYHANLNRVDEWFGLFKYVQSPRSQLLQAEIKRMLSKEPRARPTAGDLCTGLSFIDNFTKKVGYGSLFGRCCQRTFITMEKHSSKVNEMSNTINGLNSQLRTFSSNCIELSRRREHCEQLNAAQASRIKFLEAELERLRKKNSSPTQTSPKSAFFL